MQDYEKLGMFYLGKMVNPSTKKVEKNSLLLYESKNFTTHAVCVGMTGSGKTGLGITILEEAAMDKIPAIIIDPKGDLGNLLLTFPNLSPEEFKPWVDKDEADKKDMTVDEYTKFISKTWKDGLAAWGEDAERIKRFRDSVDLSIYTPASNAGIPISILNSFAAPSKEQMKDSVFVRDKVITLTSSILGLIGINADPIKSREFILISSLIMQSWENGQNLDIATLIQQVQKPPFAKMGALDVDTFYPPKERMGLSVSLNNLLASPGFEAWMQGDPLDIKQLLHSPKGKPKLSIISIAHLSESERMFFVTLLLNEFLSWMRNQPGTSSLRTLLYMDEIFGFFPPTASPPSKLPMLTLLKQARAFGVGIVLATQNPVDLDYKGLANCGTWFIGKLQTKRDKERVLEGLKVASNGNIDTKTLDKMIALTGNRTFIMRSIHEKEPILFETRWTMSYLRGPLTQIQISHLMAGSGTKSKKGKSLSGKPKIKTPSSKNLKPNVPSDVDEYFLHPKDTQGSVRYEAHVLGMGKLHFVNAKKNIDVWEDICCIVPVSDSGKDVKWDEGQTIADLKNQLQTAPLPKSTFGELPSCLSQEKNYALFSKKFETSLYQNQTYELFQTSIPPLLSHPGESEKDFRIRLSQETREHRDELVKKMRAKYATKITTLTEKVRKAQDKLSQKKQKAGLQKTETMISMGSTILGALFGRKLMSRGTISKAGSTIRQATRISRDSKDAEIAEQELTTYQQQLADLETQMNQEIAKMEKDASNLEINQMTIRPRKSDIDVDSVAVVWVAQ